MMRCILPVCDKCRLQTRRMAGKLGKYRWENNASTDSLTLNFKSSSLGIRNLLEHFTTTFTSLTCQFASLQSVFVTHWYLTVKWN